MQTLPSTTFTPATTDEMSTLSHNRTAFSRPTSLCPLEAYLGLKAMFGDPNREYIDEDKEQWVFLIQTENARITVNDWKLSCWSVHVFESNDDESRANDLIKELEQQIVKAAAKQRTVISSLSKYPVGHIIENPFSIYYETATSLLEIAKQFRTAYGRPSEKPPKIGNWSSQYTVCQAAYSQFISAIEGLLNVIYDIYLKQELREDRLIDRLCREQIDVKVRLAPIYCFCFSEKPIDHTTDAFRNFLRLVDARNNFVHANVTKFMKTAVVSYDGDTFLLRSDGGQNKSLVPSSITNIGIEEIESMKIAIDAILDQIINSMKPKHRRQFKNVMFNESINVEYVNGAIKLVEYGRG
jgi:hypothetical protein